MKKRLAMILAIAIVFSLSLSACGIKAHKRKEIEKGLKQPINCATAEGDLRVLKSEKAHVGEQISMGVAAIVPIGLVVGVVTDTEWEKIKISCGEYDKKIDAKMAEIKGQCNIE